MTSSQTHLVIIPSYNTGSKLVETVKQALARWQPVWVVLDGCTDGSPAALAEIGGTEIGLRVLSLEKNSGKGAAVLHALLVAESAGFTHALVFDADGQHSAADISRFMAASQKNPDAVILGVPQFAADAPASRRHGRLVGNWWANLETFWGGIEDSLFGFRVYPIQESVRILQGIPTARRFDFDTELAVRLFWAGVPPVNLSTPVQYFKSADGGTSHFHYLRDNLLLIRRHTLLVLEMLPQMRRIWKLRQRVEHQRNAFQLSILSRKKNFIIAPDASLTRTGRFFFRHRRLALVLILAVAVTTPVLLALNWDHKLFFIPLELGTKFLIVYPAVRANCRWFGPVVTRFRPPEKAVWLTIDDGPHPEDTPQLLKLLKKYGAHATFFVIGRQVKKNPEVARAIVRDGHALANHSQTHPVLFFWSFLENWLAREIDQCNEALREATGASTRWFRAPAGMANLFLHFLLCDRNMKLIGWSARGFDGLFYNTEAMADRICKSARPGAIILLHEGRRGRQGRPINLILVETILDRLSAEGYVFIVPDEADFLG
jgi:peptidoglycan/xylan/chitin deacetylase (PgdA/CDA1 family)/glycosyltransferase involved in cell wall biosynthesis